MPRGYYKSAGQGASLQKVNLDIQRIVKTGGQEPPVFFICPEMFYPKNGSWTQMNADQTRPSVGMHLHCKSDSFFSVKKVFLSVFIRVYPILSASKVIFSVKENSKGSEPFVLILTKFQGHDKRLCSCVFRDTQVQGSFICGHGQFLG